MRTIYRDGEPWFVAADVCRALELGTTAKALERLDEDERGMSLIHTLGGEQAMSIVNEPGLYSLVLGSRKPEAKVFKRWITHEVIPDIRKHGMYATPATVDKMLGDPDVMIALLTEYKQQKQMLIESKQIIEEQKPLVEFAETVCKSADVILMRDMAKLMCQQHINIGEKRLFKILRGHNILMSDNSPYQSYIDRGYFQVRESYRNTPYGTTILTKTTLVTPKGQVWLVGKVSEWMPISEREEIS